MSGAAETAITQTAAAGAIDAVKLYGDGDTEIRALDGVTVVVRAQPVHRHHGSVGLGQVDPDALPGRARHAEQPDGCSSATPTWTRCPSRELTELRRDKVGFIFQAFNLIPTLSAEENITLPMDLAGRKPDQAWVDQVIDTVGLRRPARPPTE